MVSKEASKGIAANRAAAARQVSARADRWFCTQIKNGLPTCVSVPSTPLHRQTSISRMTLARAPPEGLLPVVVPTIWRTGLLRFTFRKRPNVRHSQGVQRKLFRTAFVSSRRCLAWGDPADPAVTLLSAQRPSPFCTLLLEHC